MMYHIWTDESDKSGEYFSNFYGGILVRSEHLDKVLQMSMTFVEELGIKEEIKWQKVNRYTFESYMKLVDFIFDLLEHGYAKIRIFFHPTSLVPVGLTPEQRRNTYSLLYYQFIKHAFGLPYSNNTGEDVYVRLYLDDMPLKGNEKEKFLDYIYKLNEVEDFKNAHIKIRKDDIAEVNSKKHLMLQFMDLILGAMCFRLNDKHKEKDADTGKRGTRTKLKEKLYKHILQHIRTLKPNFNIGITTGISDLSDRWNHPYRHWSFKPSEFVIDRTRHKHLPKSK